MYWLACRTWVKGYSQEPLWLQSNHITAKFHPIMRGDVMEAVSWSPPVSYMPQPPPRAQWPGKEWLASQARIFVILTSLSLTRECQQLLGYHHRPNCHCVALLN